MIGDTYTIRAFPFVQMSQYHLAVYQLFDAAKHGGDEGDRPEWHYLYVAPVESSEDVEVALAFGFSVGMVKKYQWASPVSRSVYTLCTPKVISTIQRKAHLRYCYKKMRRFHHRQRMGKF